MQADKPEVTTPSLRQAEFVRLFVEDRLTMQEIGDKYRLTRERVRQILAKAGVKREDGGSSARHKARVESIRATRDAALTNRTGMTRDEYRAMQKHRIGGRRPSYVFVQYRNNIVRRNPKQDFSLTLAQWWSILRGSGKWRRYGIGKGKYALARKDVSDGFHSHNLELVPFDGATLRRKPQTQRKQNLNKGGEQ